MTGVRVSERRALLRGAAWVMEARLKTRIEAEIVVVPPRRKRRSRNIRVHRRRSSRGARFASRKKRVLKHTFALYSANHASISSSLFPSTDSALSPSSTAA